MTDYLPLLTRAVSNLGNNPEGRRAVYDRARQALVGQLRAMTPPLAEAEITRERLALEEAIRRVEAQSAKSEPPSSPAPAPPAPPPVVPRAPTAAAPGVASPPRPAPAPRTPPAPRPARTASPVGAPQQERAPEPVSGARVVRDAVASVKELGAATADAARSARDALGGMKADDTFELEQLPEPAAEVRGRNAPGAALNEPLQPRANRVRSIDYAKADAQKALKAKLIVGGIVGALLLVAILIGVVHRERILASIGLGPSPSRITQTEGPKVSDRVAPKAEVRTQSQPSPSQPAAAVAQRAVLYEENPGTGEQQLQTFVGTAVWRTETVSPGPGRPPELGLRIEVEVPDRKMTVRIAIRRNPDQTLPASHTIEVQFVTPNDPFGGVANMPGIRAKTTETAQGAPLVGLVVRVMPGFFLVGLSNIDADREQNLSLLRERGWLDVPFVYNNGRRAVLVIEKGTPGDRAVNEAIAAWGG
jgi:hypothetical protein